MRIWLYIALLVLVVYAVISVLLYYLQEYFLFKPEKLPKELQFYYDNQVVEEYDIETLDGAIINGSHYKTAFTTGWAP